MLSLARRFQGFAWQQFYFMPCWRFEMEEIETIEKSPVRGPVKGTGRTVLRR